MAPPAGLDDVLPFARRLDPPVIEQVMLALGEWSDRFHHNMEGMGVARPQPEVIEASPNASRLLAAVAGLSGRPPMTAQDVGRLMSALDELLPANGA